MPGSRGGRAGPAPRPTRAGRSSPGSVIVSMWRPPTAARDPVDPPPEGPNPAGSPALPRDTLPRGGVDAGELGCDRHAEPRGIDARGSAVLPARREVPSHVGVEVRLVRAPSPAAGIVRDVVPGIESERGEAEVTVPGATILEPPVPEMEHVPLQTADSAGNRALKPARPRAVARLLGRIHGVRADHGLGGPERGAGHGGIAPSDDAGIVESVPREHLAPVGPPEPVDGHARSTPGGGAEDGHGIRPVRDGVRGRLLREDHCVPGRALGAPLTTEVVKAREQLDDREALQQRAAALPQSSRSKMRSQSSWPPPCTRRGAARARR